MLKKIYLGRWTYLKNFLSTATLSFFSPFLSVTLFKAKSFRCIFASLNLQVKFKAWAFCVVVLGFIWLLFVAILDQFQRRPVHEDHWAGQYDCIASERHVAHVLAKKSHSFQFVRNFFSPENQCCFCFAFSLLWCVISGIWVSKKRHLTVKFKHLKKIENRLQKQLDLIKFFVSIEKLDSKRKCKLFISKRVYDVNVKICIGS